MNKYGGGATAELPPWRPWRSFSKMAASRHITDTNYFHEICLREQPAGGHFGKWPPRPPGGSSAMAPPPNELIIYWSTSVPKLVLLSKKCTIDLNIIGKPPHYETLRMKRVLQASCRTASTRAPWHQPAWNRSTEFTGKKRWSSRHSRKTPSSAGLSRLNQRAASGVDASISVTYPRQSAGQPGQETLLTHILRLELPFLSIPTTFWVKVLRPTRYKIGHLGDVLPSQSLGLVLKKLDPVQLKQITPRQNSLS